jgi:hypothetical protein
MGSVLNLVQDPVSAETVAFAQFFLQEALAGRAVGLVGAILLRGQDYTIEIIGECKKTPDLSRGLLNGVDDHLAKLAGHRY